MTLTNNTQVVVVLCVAALLWICVLVPEEHHERLVRALHWLATLSVASVILALRFLH